MLAHGRRLGAAAGGTGAAPAAPVSGGEAYGLSASEAHMAEDPPGQARTAHPGNYLDSEQCEEW